MDRTTQPVLCCLGESVAGNPTQFMMERAFASQGLDWRALTVEVAQPDLEAAIAGIRAMHFMAVRIFSPYFSAAVTQFEVQGSRNDLTGITSAQLTAEGWEGWHNLGFGIVEEAIRLGQFEHACYCLLGDSIRTRSLAAALEGDSSRKLVWIDAPPGFQSSPSKSDATIDTAAQGSEKNVEAAAANPQCDSLDEVLELVTSGALSDHQWIICFENSCFDSGEITMKQLESLLQLLQSPIVAADDMGAQHLKSTYPETRVLSEADQAVSAEAYDFQRWTGAVPDMLLLRDAYDEYCDF